MDAQPFEAKQIAAPSALPTGPAVYALYGGQGAALYPAYVGVAGNLRSRILQHLVRRDSSIVTGVSAVGLQPDKVRQVRWWEDASFVDREVLEAAELVAFDVLDPALRSRGTPRDKARELHEDPAFNERMRAVFSGKPAGMLVVPTLAEALDRIAALERRVATLEYRLQTQAAELDS